MKSKLDQLKAQIPITKIPLNTEIEYSLNQETDWINELLEEMCEHASEMTLKILRPKIFLELDIAIKKKTNSTLGDFLLVEGQIHSRYATECVKTLKPMLETLEFEFKTCFLDNQLNSAEHYGELDEIYEENDVYQIYFQQKGMADLQEMIHENIYLQYNQYPQIEAPVENQNN